MKLHLALLLFSLLTSCAWAWPEGWKVEKVVQVPAVQLGLFSQKLGGKVVAVRNTFLSVGGKSVQVNEITCADPAEARKIHARLPRTFLKGAVVTEVVGKDPELVRRAPYDLRLQPTRVSYRVKFSAAPLVDCDPMSWNKMFNAWLKGDAQMVAALRPRFQFGGTLPQRAYGQGRQRAVWSVKPAPSLHEVPQVAVEVRVPVEAFAVTPADGPGSVEATRFWPTGGHVGELARTIVGNRTGSEEKARAILEWTFRNLKYGGPVRGSRYGVPAVLSQRYGQCWDYSDVFITLCRASGVPARQVLGWLAGVEGHVWAEVRTEQGWVAMDPTAGASCGSDYVPLFTSENGEPPMVYTSAVELEPLVEVTGWEEPGD